MQISIFSDTHCGFGYGTEREEDSFIALEEAIEKSLDSDLILIAGDVFDTKIPKPEIFARTARILSRAQHIPSKTRLIEIINKDKKQISPLALRGIPIVSIHGTHERRSPYNINPIQQLEHTGLLIHLDRSTVVFEIDNHKVAVHGMSGVPEQYAKKYLEEWNPQPIKDAINILMIHQSITPYIYSPKDPPSLHIDDLPDGFDLYVLGHIHWHELRPFKSGNLLLTGSTISTSSHKREAESEKYIFKLDKDHLRKIPLEKQRKIIIEEFKIEGDIKTKIDNFLATLAKQPIKPVVIIKITGKAPKHVTLPNLNYLVEKYKDKLIVNIKKDYEIEGFEEQVEMLRKLRERKLSPKEHGLEILKQKLAEVGLSINIDDIFDVLAEGDSEMAFNILTGKQKTLVNI
ncbi:MAG: DNA repair exonuclease [Candidatus Aenigmarchaeota archaeon]|nr:DNA repair exonuclease [Candidatus Aenigmarchaeota archaeon]